jgi:hypothetical protein
MTRAEAIRHYKQLLKQLKTALTAERQALIKMELTSLKAGYNL